MDETRTLRKEEKNTFWRLKIELDDEMMETTTMEMELKQKYKELNLTLNLSHLTIIHHNITLTSV
ncbi:hypothetical protein KY285_036362 [Solanum tuberosum]|nr:hypothetical protein KY285_036362 [Solanum tuberosum]